MRILMLGTGQFAVPMFEAILAAGHEVPALITRPVPPPSGRKKELLHPNPMRDYAEARRIAIHAPETTNADAARDLIRSFQPDLLAVCDFGEILSPETLAIARLGGINLHASLLPKYRGAAPINWAILKGETETGVSVIHMTPKLDGGPVLATARTPIDNEETAAELEPRLARLGVQPVLQSIRMLEAWDGVSPLGAVQDPALATHARRLRKTDGEVVWTRSSQRIKDQVRGLQPWPGVFTHLLRTNEKPLRVIVEKVSCVPGGTDVAAAGEIVVAERDRLLVQTGDGQISLDQLKPAGKRSMDAAEFIRGYKPTPGERFGAIAAS
jgi:methionyl-tRNA formyltransferase